MSTTVIKAVGWEDRKCGKGGYRSGQEESGKNHHECQNLKIKHRIKIQKNFVKIKKKSQEDMRKST